MRPCWRNGVRRLHAGRFRASNTTCSPGVSPVESVGRPPALYVPMNIGMSRVADARSGPRPSANSSPGTSGPPDAPSSQARQPEGAMKSARRIRPAYNGRQLHRTVLGLETCRYSDSVTRGKRLLLRTVAGLWSIYPMSLVGSCVRASGVDPAHNPEAPSVILPDCGRGRERWADALCAQKGPVPVYLKRASKEWEYVGDYVVERSSRSHDEIRPREVQTGRPVTRVIYMRAILP